MAKRTRPIKVGLVLPTVTRPGRAPVRWSEVETMARIAEDIGFDSLWVVDHFLYQMQGAKEAQGCWECWSWLSALAACTRRTELGTAVLGLGFRNPALLAKMADTVEEISNGRLILGVGAGYHELEYRAFGFPYDHRYSRFAEAIQIVHGLLRNGRVDFHGQYHEARECELKPRGPRRAAHPVRHQAPRCSTSPRAMATRGTPGADDRGTASRPFRRSMRSSIRPAARRGAIRRRWSARSGCSSPTRAPIRGGTACRPVRTTSN